MCYSFLSQELHKVSEQAMSSESFFFLFSNFKLQGYKDHCENLKKLRFLYDPQESPFL